MKPFVSAELLDLSEEGQVKEQRGASHVADASAPSLEMPYP